MSGYTHKNNKPRYVQKKQENSTSQNQIMKNELPQQSKKIQRQNQQNTRTNQNRKFRYNQRREEDPNSENEDNKRRVHHRQDKNHHKRFVKNEENIKFFTQIEALPQVRKVKPNQEAFKQKINQLEDKIAKTKELRKQEKEKLKKAEEQFKNKQEAIKDRLESGYKVMRQFQNEQKKLKYQIEKISDNIGKIENKIKSFGKKQQEKKKKPEQMTYEQLDYQLKKLQHILISSNLTKQQITDINIQRTNFNRLKVNALPSTKSTLNDEQFIETQKAKLIDRKQFKKKKKIELLQIEVKLQAIDADLDKYQNELDQLHAQEESFKNSPQYEKAKQYKEQIRKLRAELKQVQTLYYNSLDDYNLEQKLIDYIVWANEVKKKKIQQHELEKQERRKQRQKQRRRQDKKGDKDQKTKKGQQQPQRERLPPPHPFSKEILDLRFLIQYCNDLKPREQKQEINSQTVKTKEQIEKQIQKGQWAKQKGVAIVKSKKDNDLQFAINISKGKKKPNNAPISKQQPERITEINHIIQIVRLFDTFKILPPTKIEDLESVLKQLQQKKVYYSGLTTEELSKQNQQRKYERRNPEQKSAKGLNPTKKANISIIDFPDLV